MAEPFAGAFKALEYFEPQALDLKGPASKSDISAAEDALGVALPSSYCEFLLRHNGGRLPGEFVYGVPPTERHLDTVELTLFERGNTDGFPPGLVVLRPDGRGNYFCLATDRLNEDAECPVVFWQWRESFVSAPIASTFERFFELLCTVLPKYYEEDGDPKRGVEEEAWHSDLDYIRTIDPDIDAVRAAWQGVLALLLIHSTGLLAQEPSPADFVEGHPEMEVALEKGLHYLASRQKRSGMVGEQYPIASTALAGVAFLGSGHTPSRGLYADNLRRCIRYLSSRQLRTGYISVPGSQMYDHGFATLFLAEVYGTYPDAELKATLQKAIDLIERSQTPPGWDYGPAPSGQSDISITICQVMAMRAARNVGVEIDEQVIERALACVLRAQNADGGFSYRIGAGWGGDSSEYPRSAAGACILYNLGQYDHPATARALAYLERFKTISSGFYFYARYYASQAMFQAGGEHWQRFWPGVRSELLRGQAADGSWSQGSGGPTVSTAMACIILSIPFRYLPIFER